MSEQDHPTSNYCVYINHANGVAIGDSAHVGLEPGSAPPPPPPASRAELLTTIHRAAAVLRTYPSDIAGIHLVRSEATQIAEWALNAASKEHLGMLLDQPGGGKTVVMHDVLEQLETAQVPTLAIKADALSSIKTRADLAARLGLPAPVEVCARHLAAEGPFIVLLDQLDALSLALSRDQPTLDVMLDTLARLREIEGVRIVASCRTFDLNNDPRLNTIKVDHKFSLHPLEEEQVNLVLHAIAIDPRSLLPAHRALLTVPLHLDIYARVVSADPPGQNPESFRTLQELYEALWRKRIEAVPPDRPSPAERIAAIYRLVEAMQTNRRLTAPVAVLDKFTEAAGYLEHEGFIRREGSNWLFLHQTLFDYCYARRFVAQGQSLCQEILGGPQGLFERSQMVQVLAYLRGTDEQAYLQELTSLLFAADLRVHLRLLLIGWFGALPNPTDSELRIARRLMQDADSSARFLQAAEGNTGWFDLLHDNDLSRLLGSDDLTSVDIVINYLSTLTEKRTEEILAHVRPYLGKSEAWDARIAYCLSRLESWQNADALDVLCDLLGRGRMLGREGLCFRHLAESNPAGGCRALRAYLDHRLDHLLAQEAEQTGEEPDSTAVYRTELPDRYTWERQLLGEYALGELMDRAVVVCPQEVIDQLLSWLVRAATVISSPGEMEGYYPSDPLFSWGWYGDHISEGAAFAWRMTRALQHFARTQPAVFRHVAAELAAVESLAVHRLLAQAYLADAETYADDIFDYLIVDERRLNVGDLEDTRYDSGRLYGAAFQYVDPERRNALERIVLNYQPAWELRGIGRQGITQLRFLKNVPPNLLSGAAHDRLQELERKFPGFELHHPRGVTGGFVGSPIERDAQAKMSDDAWLGAMRKYDDSTGWGAPREEFLKGGIVELSRSFAERVKDDPDRFYRLAQRFDESISLHYVAAAISGLAESDAPADWVFDLVRQFVPRIQGAFRGSVCWALEKRAEAGVPDDLLDVMSDWAIHDPNPAEELWCTPAEGSGQPYYGGDPHSHGINSNRGAAIHAVSHCAWKRTPPQVERIFCLLEQAANDPSTAVRTCVIENLGPLLNEDDTRTLKIFEQTLEGHPALLQNSLVHHFLYWTCYRHFPRIRPVIEALLANPDDATRQAGSRLACLAAFQHTDAHDLVNRVMQGDAAMRRGAAQVYARNLEKSDVRAICLKQLVILMHDPDEKVRAHVGESFRHLQAEHVDELRPFVEQFLTSPALSEGASHVIEYLQALAIEEHETVLAASAHILDVAGDQILDIRTSLSVYEDDLVRLPLAVYTHATDPGVKSRAMDLFERMLLMGSREAHQALSDWDRR